MTPSHCISSADALADLGAFDAIIDVRSPAEFAEDHLPGAVNWPVLDNEQRRVVRGPGGRWSTAGAAASVQGR